MPTNSTRAWRAGCACRTARRSAPPARRRGRRVGRIDAMRAVQWRGRADRRRLRRDHVDLRAVPRLRAGVPERGAVRSPDRGHPPAAGRERTPHAMVAAAGLLGAAAPPAAAGRVDGAGGRPTAATGAAAGSALRALPLRRGPAVAATGTDAWLFTGCVMDAWMRDTHRPRRGCSTRSVSGTRSPVQAAGAAARCTPTPGSTTSPWSSALERDGVDARRRPDPRQLGRVRGGAQGLRPPARHRRRPAVLGAGVRHPRVDRAAARPRCRSCAGSTQPVIVQDPCHLRHVQRAHLPVRTVVAPRRRRGRARRRRAVLRRRRRLLGARNPSWPATIRDRKLAPIDRAVARSGATLLVERQPGVQHASAAVARRPRHRRSATRSTCWPRRCRESSRDRAIGRPARSRSSSDLDEIAFDRLRRRRPTARPSACVDDASSRRRGGRSRRRSPSSAASTVRRRLSDALRSLTASIRPRIVGVAVAVEAERDAVRSTWSSWRRSTPYGSMRRIDAVGREVREALR